jgi:hypothetical protein
LEGQTYALELAFAVNGTHAEQAIYPLHAFHFTTMVDELKARFLTSNVKAMVGYAIGQANLYSFKGERLNAARAVYSWLADVGIISINVGEVAFTKLEDVMLDDNCRLKMQAIADKFPKYVSVTTYDIGDGQFRPCIKLLEKTLPFTSTITHTAGVVDNLIGKYGTRADAATQDNVDWKAMMHTTRIVDQGLSLLQTGKIVHPFSPSDVKRYLSIKHGEQSIEVLRDELAAKVDKLKELELNSKLPKLTPELKDTFETWLLGHLKKFYEIH